MKFRGRFFAKYSNFKFHDNLSNGSRVVPCGRTDGQTYAVFASCFVFQFAIQKYKDQETQNYNFVCCLHGCETWSLNLREEPSLRLFKNKVLTRIIGPKRDEVTGEWRKLHNVELNDLYCSPNIVRVIKSRRMK